MFRRKKDKPPPPTPPSQPILHCSFCNKTQREVKKMIAGPSVQICDECTDICVSVLSEERKDAIREATVEGHGEWAGRNWPEPGTLLLCALCRIVTPFENSLALPERGVICAGCVGVIQAELAQRQESS